MRPRQAWGAALVVGVATVFAHPALAQDREACARAYEDAQMAMRRNRLSIARDHLRVCLSDVCPAVLRPDCASWLKEVEARSASVVLVAKGKNGEFLTNARVQIDGQPLVDHEDGVAVDVDPGQHTFRFEASDGSVVEVPFVVREGEKSQRIEGDFPRPATPDVVTPPPPSPVAPVSRPVPTSAYVLSGVGLAAAAGFGTFAAIGKSGQNDLDRCSPHCDGNAVDAVRTKYAVADVMLGVSLLSLGAAAYLYLTRPVAQINAGTVVLRPEHVRSPFLLTF